MGRGFAMAWPAESAAPAWIWVVPLLGYLLGGVLPAEYLVRWRRGASPRELGDEPGTAGTWRQAGPAAGLAVFAFDFAKGLLPVALVDHLAGEGWWLVAAAAAPVAGHNWPLQRCLRPGGRGLASAIGATVYLAPGALIPALLAGCVVALWRRRTPWVGIVGFPLGLVFMLAGRLPGWRVLAAMAAMVTVGLRYLQWTRQRGRWI
ncbi:glycerol-3-phosphate acyltransferase [Thermaerobacter sp. PB12/4term]|uniref:glycerol-3-phosphate acyltransferase n=1 Tax=Thermaerobacter sp. PB12/4term TaxID=2293838 RepID=UPI000E3297EB|nr:glycerol-3-phosphate acyltransferase [Thermaerobacter sp. PB12/4term]QIA26774.1 glycerol-3-phosphate acyltransferase [Thermaerobacter sp. PB12/4term]